MTTTHVAAFPGWRMVRALAVTEAISYGAMFYAFAVMLVPMRESFDAGTGEISLALTISLAVTGVAAVPAGRWLDRHGARGLMTVGSLLGAASVVGWSQARTLPQLYLAFAGIGLAGAAVLYEPAFAVINTWFRQDRHRALLTLTVIAGFSSTVFVPLSQLLVDGIGWRNAVLVLAALTGACAIPHALLLRRSPQDLALHPDGRVPHGEIPQPHEPGPVPRAASTLWRTRTVRYLTAAAVLEGIAVTAVAVHLVAYLRDDGVGPTSAAAASGAIGALQVAGRILMTRQARRFGLARVAATIVAGQAVGVAALFAFPTAVGVVVFVVLFGAGFGVMTLARPALLGTFVGPEVFASVSGAQTAAITAGRVAAPIAAGSVIAAQGYAWAFTGIALCCVAAAVLILGAQNAAGHLRG
jgi:MFS family permease